MNMRVKERRNEVKKNMNNVLRAIENWIVKNKPTPNPSREGN